MSSISDYEQHRTTFGRPGLSSDHLFSYTSVVPETASVVAEEDPTQPDPTRSFKSSNSKPRRCGFDLDDSWALEIGSAVLSVVGIALLFGFLVVIHEKPYADWQYTASPNTIISIIAAITKAALLNAVSACLGQLKWRLYERSSSTPLENMQKIDEASRGSWGSLKVLLRMVSGSKLGILTFWGALLTFLAPAVDPFAQQILSFPSRQVQVFNETAFIQSARNYTAPNANAGNMTDLQTKAINSGLSLPDTGLQAQCTAEECSYPGFVSLGICSKCEDVTERTTQVCMGAVVPHAYLANGPYINMNCTYTAPDGYNLSLPLYLLKTGTVDYSETMNGIAVNFYASYPKAPPWEDLQLRRYKMLDIQTPIVSFLSVTQFAQITYTRQNTTAWPPKPTFTECVMYWCEKEFAPSNFSTTSDPTPVSRTQQLQIVLQDEGKDWMTNIYTFVTPPGLTPLSNESSTYHISEYLSMDLGDQLKDLFNDTSRSSAMYHALVANNVTDVVKSISTSLTDVIRSFDMSSSRIPGKAFRTETYIHVRWPWIILPLFVVLASTVFLLATTMSTRNAVLWKNSLLPLLRRYLHVEPEDDSIPLRSVDQVTRH